MISCWTLLSRAAASPSIPEMNIVSIALCYLLPCYCGGVCSESNKGSQVMKQHPDVRYLELRCQTLEEEISLSAHEATIRNLTLRKLYLEDELELLRQQRLNLERRQLRFGTA
jgi:hypothetical protein